MFGRVDSYRSILSHRAPVAIALLASSAILAMSCSARAEESAAPLVPAPSADRPSSSQRDRAHVAVVGGIGFPRPLAIEALFGVNRILAIGLEYSFLPVTSIGGIDTSFSALAGDARFFPFRNSFFLGVRGGRQHLGRSATLTVPPYGSFHGSIDVDTWFINPRAGFLWMWESGLAIGSDVGVQIPLASNVSSTLPSGLLTDPRVTSVTSTFATSVIPTFDLLRIGLAL